MRNWIAGLIGRLGPRTVADPVRTPDEGIDRAVVRRLRDRLDRAERLGLHDYAERLAADATPLITRHPSIAERVARLHLRRGRVESALEIIETTRADRASLRLLRLVCLVVLGRRAEAHAELMHWSVRPTAPLDARRLLALIEWDDGYHGAAIDALLRNVRLLDDPRSMAALVLLCLERGRVEQAATWADRLGRRLAVTAGDDEAHLLLASIGMGRAQSAVQPSADQVRRLATELLAAEDALPALVEAQRRAPEPVTARFLAAAIETALFEFEEPPAAMEALARLALVLDEPGTAERWIRRAQGCRPYAASLAILEQEIERRRRPIEPPADEPSQGRAA